MDRIGISVGCIIFLYFLVMIVLRPIARHSFILRVLKRLYFVRTASDKKLVNPKKEGRMNRNMAEFLDGNLFLSEVDYNSMDDKSSFKDITCNASVIDRHSIPSQILSK